MHLLFEKRVKNSSFFGFVLVKNNATFAAVNLLQKMGCLKLDILNEQYKSTELKESYNKKELTSEFCNENARRYLVFGTTSYRSGRSETEVSLKRYKYNGKERDEETGLYAYGMRYYAAWICRFVSVDPLQFDYPELTPFQYASNNPVTMIDLDGLEGVNPEESDYRVSVLQINMPKNEKLPLLKPPPLPQQAEKLTLSSLVQTEVFIMKPDPAGGLGRAVAQLNYVQQKLDIASKDISESKSIPYNPGEIRQGKSSYEEHWEFSVGPFFAPYIKTDPVIKPIAIGGAATVGVVAGNAAYETGAMLYQTEAGKIVVGGAVGAITNYYNAGPEATIPDPISNTAAQVVDLTFKLHEIITRQFNQIDTIQKNNYIEKNK